MVAVAAAVVTLAIGGGALWYRSRRTSSASSGRSSSALRDDTRFVDVDARRDVAAYEAQIAALEKAPLDTAKLGADLGGNFGIWGAIIGAIVGFFAGGIYAIAVRAPKNVRSFVRTKVVEAIRREGEEATEERILYGMQTAALVMYPAPVGIDLEGNLLVQYPRGFPTGRNPTRIFLDQWFQGPIWEYAAETHDGVARIERRQRNPWEQRAGAGGWEESTRYYPHPGWYRIRAAESDRGLEEGRDAVLQLVAEPVDPSAVVVADVPARHHGMVAFHLAHLLEELS